MKILNITDTRTWVEGSDDKWHPIAGSGITRECERCSRDHEVHVTVQDGEKAYVVGTGCAVQGNMMTSKQAKSGNSTAKTIAQWEGKIEALKVQAEEWQRIYREITRVGTFITGRDTANRTRVKSRIYGKKERQIMENKIRERMGITLITDEYMRFESDEYELDPVSKLEKAEDALYRAQKRMAKVVNG